MRSDGRRGLQSWSGLGAVESSSSMKAEEKEEEEEGGGGSGRGASWLWG